MGEGIKSLFNRFPKVFWIVQSFELMERGAYYTMMPILAVHFHWNVGVPLWLCLLLTVFMYPFQYGMPILSSALAEKVGYRKQMIFGFSVLFLAYLFLSFADSPFMAVMGVILIGFGIGCYKPLVSSTVAKCTAQKDRNVAYSIYYWVVNFAAFVLPLAWGGLLVAGLFSESMYAWVFRIGSSFFLINIFVAVFFFKEVPRSGDTKTFKDVKNNIKTAFVDRKFVVMMLLIAGFWALYSTTLAPFQTIMYGFHFLPSWFPVMLLGVFNPGTIILLGIPLAKFVEKMESLKVLMGGVVIYLIGITVMVFFIHMPVVAIMGILIYSVGEFMVAPGYLAFVSKLAPKEKVSAYIGCNFLASFLGIWGGALLWGLLANFVAVGWRRPHFYYSIVLSVGLLVLIGFIVYYKKWGQDIIERAKHIQAMEEKENGEVAEDNKLDKPFKEPFMFKMFEKRATIVVSLILIPIILVAAFFMGTNNYYPPDHDDDEGPVFSLDDYDIVVGPEISLTSSASENSEIVEAVEIILTEGQLLSSIKFQLTWQDEPDQEPGPFGVIGMNNQPDEFSINVSLKASPLDDTSTDLYGEDGPAENPPGGVGFLTYETQLEHNRATSLNGVGTWSVTIFCGNCGDYQGAIRSQSDTGNAYTLTVTTMVYEMANEMATE